MNTTLSLGSGVGTTCPRVGSLCEISAVRYLSSLNFLRSSSVTKEGIHRPWRLDPNMIEGPKHLTWALGVRTRGGGRIRLSTGGKKVKALSLYKEGEYQASSVWLFGTCLKSRSHTNKHDWVTHTRIDENPMIRGTRSLLRQYVPRKPLR